MSDERHAERTGRRRETAFGWRARIGLIVPETNTVNEPEWALALPDGVSVHTARMRLHLPSPGDEHGGAPELDDGLAAAIDRLVPARPDVIAYACTAGSLIVPPEELERRMAQRAGRPCVTTAAALVRRLRVLGARRIVVATPYDERLNEHEAAFLGACGFDVLAIAGLGHGSGGPAEYLRIAETQPAAIEALVETLFARDAVARAAEAILVSCTDLPTASVVPRLEVARGLPIVTSNAATLWAALQAAGPGADGFSRATGERVG